ncbi:MAG: hypothetical protein RMJ82_15325 [Gemmatales bacterium]|nr:hypothetical protein [Gemmatales bacterium]
MVAGYTCGCATYQDAEDENVLVKQPAAVYVEQVYHYGDFALLGTGT